MTRKQARENAFILLFEAECRDDQTAQEIFEYAEQLEDFDCDDYVKKAFFGAQEIKTEIKTLIDEALVGWTNKRVSPVSKALLLLATFEMLAAEDVPPKVAINEAIELSKKYDEEKAYIFVNGVLNKIAQKLALM